MLLWGPSAAGRLRVVGAGSVEHLRRDVQSEQKGFNSNITRECMKASKILVAAVAFVSVCAASAAQAQDVRARSLAQICPTSQDVGSQSSTIYKQSAPLRSGGVGTPLVGYRKEPTLIYNKRNFSGSTATIYDSQGNSIARCPHTSAHGHAGRARCTVQTTTVRRAAVRRTGSPTIYFKVSGRLCVKVPDAGRCVGSVKGLCNQLIK